MRVRKRTLLPLSGRSHPTISRSVLTKADPAHTAHTDEVNERKREFTAVVWPEQGGPQERVSIMAESREDATALLRQTYGLACEFDLIDVEAANRPR